MEAQHSYRSTEMAVGGPLSAERLSINWIISPRTDLCCFIGGALAGYAMFSFMLDWG